LRRDDQQYMEWLRAEPLQISRKLVVVVSGSSHSQAPWWRKKDNPRGPLKNHTSNSDSELNLDNTRYAYSSAMEADIVMDNFEISRPNNIRGVGVLTMGELGDCS